MGSRWAPKAGKLSTWPLRPRRASQSLQTSPLPTCISRNPPGDHGPDGLGTGTPTLHLSILQVPPTAPSSAQPKHLWLLRGRSEQPKPLRTSEGFFSFCRDQLDLVFGSLEHLDADVV